MLPTQEHPTRHPAGIWHTTWTEIQPSLVIAQREIIDTLRDWRIVLPIVVLVLGFPFLANFAASKGVNFVNRYGADLIMERMLPFLMLVVGFFPSSFSLVIALETFMGEKERRSLEPLLSTPLTDVQLYVGKLVAATVPPVVASYLGMLFYVILMGLSMGWWPPLPLLFLGFMLSTAEALVMVAGAVVISSQSTSVRAANLLASFVIIPMAFLLQAEASLLLFANYAALWAVVAFLLVLNVLLIRLGLRIFDREHLLGRDIDTIDLRKSWQTFRDAVWPRYGFRGLFTQELPQLLRRIWPELLITLLVVIGGGAWVGIWGSQLFPLPAHTFDFTALGDMQSIDDAISKSQLLSSFSPWTIFYHNARTLVGSAFLAVFSMGILALLLLLAPIAIIFYLTLQISNVGINPWTFLSVLVLPHAIFEFPAAIIATAQAMRMGDVILSPPEAGGGMRGMIRETGHFIKLLVALVLPLLFIAAWIERWVTPYLAVKIFGH